MHLLIDDLRNLGADAIVRSAQVARIILKETRGWTHLYLDHDLGEHSDMDGGPLLNWMIEHDVVPPFVQLVTDNPVGRENMQRALENIGYTTRDGRNFERK